MKQVCTLIIGILCLLSPSLEARTVQEASAVASAFIQARSEATPAKRMQKAADATSITTPVELAFTQYQVDNTTPAVYVFNSTDEGFVLVSAEDNARTVLGYSDEGIFDANNIPENMQFWLQMYADEMKNKPTSNPSLKGRVAMQRKGVVSAQGEKAMRHRRRRRVIHPSGLAWGRPYGDKASHSTTSVQRSTANVR